MALPSSGQISLSEVNIELVLQSTAQISLNDSAVRVLFNKTSGPISMSDGWGKQYQFELTLTTDPGSFWLELDFERDLRPFLTQVLNPPWDQISKLVLIISDGVYVVSSDINIPALRINGSFPNGFELVNNGYIVGRGGDGWSAYGTNTGPYGVYGGTPGGLAMDLLTNVSIRNNAFIAGGGGGGAAGANGLQANMRATGGGGGAGGGWGGNGFTCSSSTCQLTGFGGSPGLPGQRGQASPVISDTSSQRYGGAGGGRILPGQDSPFSYTDNGGFGGGGTNYPYDLNPAARGGGENREGGDAPRGDCGAGGGGYGAKGGNSPSNIGTRFGSAGGKAINLNGYSVTWLNTGTVYGAVS